MFSFEQALAQNTRLVRERQLRNNRSTAYVLYYSNDAKRYDGKITGVTVKSIIAEFRTTYSTYKYAMITKLGSDEVIRFYNRDLSKKFFAPARKGGKKKAA